MAYGVHDFDEKQFGIAKLVNESSTFQRAYDSGKLASIYLQDSRMYEDRIKEILFRRNKVLAADNYTSKSIDSLVSSKYLPILPKYFDSPVPADNYHSDRKYG